MVFMGVRYFLKCLIIVNFIGVEIIELTVSVKLGGKGSKVFKIPKNAVNNKGYPKG
jgi:hypothetical protein